MYASSDPDEEVNQTASASAIGKHDFQSILLASCHKGHHQDISLQWATKDAAKEPPKI